MSALIKYKDYYSKVEYDAESNILYGKIEGINDLVTFQSDSAKTIEKEFQDAVDDYLAFCEEVGKNPNKPYSGTFNVRVSPELHRDASIFAMQNDMSLNETVNRALSNLIENKDYLNTMTEYFTTAISNTVNNIYSGFSAQTEQIMTVMEC